MVAGRCETAPMGLTIDSAWAGVNVGSRANALVWRTVTRAFPAHLAGLASPSGEAFCKPGMNQPVQMWQRRSKDVAKRLFCEATDCFSITYCIY